MADFFSHLATNNGVSLYQPTDISKSQSVFFLTSANPGSSNTISLESAWNTYENITSAFLFLPLDKSIKNPDNFITDFLSELTSLNISVKSGLRLIGWINDPDNIKGAFPEGHNLIVADFKIGQSDYYLFQIDKTPGFVEMGNLGINCPIGATLSIDPTATPLGISMKVDTAGGGTPYFSLEWGASSNPTKINIEGNNVLLPLEGSLTGCLTFDMQPRRGDFYNLFAVTVPTEGASPAAEMMYTFGPQPVTSIRYPIFMNGSDSQNPFYLQSSIDPFRLVDGTRTYFNFNTQKHSNQITIDYGFFVDTQGDPINLQPTDTGGFGLGRRPISNLLYLTPNGQYQIAQKKSGDYSKVQVLCGISGTEFLLMATGDYLEFSNAYIPSKGALPIPCPGHAAHFIDKFAPIDQLDDTTSTNWVKVSIDSTSQDLAFGRSADIKESYCVQSPGAVFFKAIDGKPYAMAIGCRMADLSKGSEAFPMAPYKGVNGSTDFPIVFSKTLVDFELEVISPNRRRRIQPDECLGPLFFDTKLNSPLMGGYVRTPNGMLVGLNDGKASTAPAGTWKELLLAKSPINNTQFLSIGIHDTLCNPAYEVVNPQLSNAIMDNAPFIVITKGGWSTHQGASTFKNEIKMGEFTFQLDVDRNKNVTNPNDPYTIIIFKLTKGQSVLELSQLTNRWTNSDYFVGAADIGKVSAQIAKCINDADPTTNPVFEDFHEKMMDKDWTGLIAINCSLDYKELPNDLLMLLGGIQGPLMAHHFGLTVNQLEPGKDIDPINNSSLFGLVHYSANWNDTNNQGDYSFQVLKLDALFKNSALSFFDSEIGMRVPRLFEEKTKMTGDLPNDSNVITINGVYQKDPDTGVGKIVFNSQDKFVFDFNAGSSLRVPDKMVVTHAALLPINKVAENGDIQVISLFSMGGGLGFTDFIIPADLVGQGFTASIGQDSDKNTVDLFSFGIDDEYNTKGLGVSNYNLQISTKITGNIATIDSISPRYDEIQMFIQNDGTSDQSRTGSFYDTFPLTFVDFEFNLEKGLSASDLKGRQMKFGTTVDTELLQNVAPHFALRFKVNFGSSGAAGSKDNVMQGDLIAGWTIARQDTADDNQVGMIFLPTAGLSTDGKFKIEGVFNGYSGDILLDRYPIDDKKNSPLIFVITLKDVDFSIFTLQLGKRGKRSLTFFGDPHKPKHSNLIWFFSDPDLNSAGADEAFRFSSFGVQSGLDLVTDPTTINVIGPTITKLTTVSLATTQKIIKSIYAGEAFNGVVKYNPKAGKLVWAQIEFSGFSLMVLFDEPSLYGGLIKLGKLKDWPKLKGLELIFIYRKINDNLGEYAGQFSLPPKMTDFEVGNMKIVVPSLGLEYFTNGDFKFTAGWPFSSKTSFAPGAQQLKMQIPVGVYTLEWTAGLYFARLRSEDYPAEFGTTFNSIVMFGIGASLGIGFKLDDSDYNNYFEFSIGVAGWLTYEGMFASKNSDISKGVDYVWAAGQVGGTIYMIAAFDFYVISGSLSFETTIALSLAFETGHRTEIQITLSIKIEIKFTILGFIHCSFRCSISVPLLNHNFGAALCSDGSTRQPALVSGPSVSQACGYKPGPEAILLSRDAFAPESVAPISRPHAASYTHRSSEEAFTHAAVAQPTQLTLYFVVQPTAVFNAASTAVTPFGVASLFIESSLNADFTNMAKGIGDWMFAQSKGSDFIAQLQNVLDNMSSLEEGMMTAMENGDLFTFTILPHDQYTKPDTTMAIFPIIPGLSADYGGETLDFDQNKASLQEVKTYYSQLSHSDSKKTAPQETSAVSVTQAVFKDYFSMIAKNLFSTILKLAKQKKAGTMEAAYDALIALDKTPDGGGFINISGMVSRHMLHGMQLPDPTDQTLKPLYSLTHQQFELKSQILDFKLQQGTAGAWVKLNPSTGVIDHITTERFLTKAPDMKNWATNTAALNPLASFTRTYHFVHKLSWTDSTGKLNNLRTVPDSLVQLIAHEPNLTLVAKQLPSDSGDIGEISTNPNLPTVATAPALYIKIKLKQIAHPDDPTNFYPNVFEVEGTDETTREQIQCLLDDKQAPKIAGINLLTSSGQGSYTSPKNQESALLVRTNLTTVSQPDVSVAQLIAEDGLSAESSLGPLKASLTVAEGKDFLRLIWEVSIVHTKGFFLMLDGLDTNLFQNQETAPVAILVQLGTPADQQPMKPYYNMIVLDNAQSGNAVGAYLQDDKNKALQIYRPNYPAGGAGFSIKTTTLSNPGLDKPGDYLFALYQFIQYRITSIIGGPGFTPITNWSLPLGAHSEANPQNKDWMDWTFRQTIPVPRITGAPNRYAAVGSILGLEVRVLDMFGNANPNTWKTPLTVKYNDPLLSPDQWPGVHFSYKILPVSGKPQLMLQLEYSDEGMKKNGKVTDPATSLGQAFEKYQMIYDQLTDPNVTVSIDTTLAAGPVTKAADGALFQRKLSDFVQQVLQYLNSPEETVPQAPVLNADLDPTYITTLEKDIIELDVRLTISRDKAKVDADVSNLFNEVLSAYTIVLPHIAGGGATDPRSGLATPDQSSLVYFAQAFEKAYQDFAGPKTFLKVAQGPKKTTATDTTVRQIYAIRWGKDVGIHVEVPNSGTPKPTEQPGYFAPAPLSTSLLTNTFDGLIDYTNSTVGVEKTFHNIDLDLWARYFLNAFHGLLSPDLSTAIAELDELDTTGNSTHYKTLITTKESLAKNITGNVTNIIDGMTLIPAEARAVFEQSLLGSVTQDYNTSVIVQLPVNVTVKGTTPKHAPRLYGKISAKEATNPSGGNNEGKEFTFSNGSLAADNESEQFAFTIAAKRPEKDAFLQFQELCFDIAFIEYKFEDDETSFGFTPSSWLTIVLPNDDATQIDLGPIHAPIPLRSYPPAPTLFAQKQLKPASPPKTLQDSLNWDYYIQVSSPVAEQDELNLSLRFNTPIKQQGKTVAAVNGARKAPKDLFEGLARFIYEYPQLAPNLGTVVQAAAGKGDPVTARALIAQIADLAEGISGAWGDWNNPGISSVINHRALESDEMLWTYSINKVVISENEIQLIVKRGEDVPVWPQIKGYSDVGVNKDGAMVYSGSGSDGTLELTFPGLFILTHQSVNVEAKVVRNADLALPGQMTNPAFVYTTETVRFPMPLIPLNNNAQPIPYGNGNDSLDTKLNNLFNLFFTDPKNNNAKVGEIKFSLNVETKFTLANDSVRVRTPVLFSNHQVKSSDISTYITDLMNGLSAVEAKSLSLVITIFSNMSDGQLPLVMYSEIDLPAPATVKK